MKKFLSPQQFKLSKADLAPQKEISESPEDETQSDMEKLQVPISDHSVGRATDELGEPAKRLENKSSSPESKFSLSNLFSNKSQFSTRQLTQASQSIVGSSGKVGKTSLSTNSDEGEFSSIMTIDYSETIQHTRQILVASWESTWGLRWVKWWIIVKEELFLIQLQLKHRL